MQVMTKVHSDKYEGFGGKLAAFDPIANLRVGIKVLQECINPCRLRGGWSQVYVGAGNMEDDGGYTAKVLAEHGRLQQVVSAGRAVPPIRRPGHARQQGPVQPQIPTESQPAISARKTRHPWPLG
jgi:hypothetical protein